MLLMDMEGMTNTCSLPLPSNNKQSEKTKLAQEVGGLYFKIIGNGVISNFWKLLLYNPWFWVEQNNNASGSSEAGQRCALHSAGGSTSTCNLLVMVRYKFHQSKCASAT